MMFHSLSDRINYVTNSLNAESLMVSIPLQIVLYYVMFTCENCFKPIARLIFHLNRILRHSRNSQLHRRLQLLLLQLMNQRLTLTAMNFMEINFFCLKDVGLDLHNLFWSLEFVRLSFSDDLCHHHLPCDLYSVHAEGWNSGG